MFNLLLFELKSRLKAIIGWGIGLTLFGALYIGIYPEVEEEMMALSDLSIYQVMGMSLAGFEDFVASIVLLFLPLILGVYAIITSTKTLAGEEDAGTLELLVARPLHRWQIVLAKTLGIAISMAGILVLAGIGCGAVLAAVNQIANTELSPVRMALAVMSAWPLTMAFATIALCLGALLPNRRLASMTATVLFIGSYFAENLAGMVSSLEPYKAFSLFSYYDSSAAIFTEGVAGKDALVLFGTIVVFLALTLWAFARRNITVGAWPWVRNRPE